MHLKNYVRHSIFCGGEKPHTGLTRVRSIRFLLFEIRRVLVLYSIIIYFTDLFILYIFIRNVYAKKKANKLCLMGQLWSKVTAFWNIDRTVKSTWPSITHNVNFATILLSWCNKLNIFLNIDFFISSYAICGLKCCYILRFFFARYA